MSFFSSFVAFTVLKTSCTISQFQRKNLDLKRPNIAQVIDYSCQFGLDTKSQNIFAHILVQGATSLKPIFPLKPQGCADRFEYHEE